jgi:predicted membrane protein
MRFNSEFTLTWIIPILIFSALLAFWFYKNQTWLSSVSKRIKWLLIVLRSFGIFGILVLLLGIIFNSITQREEKPILIAVFDTSTSLLNYKDSAKVVSQITDFKTNFTEHSIFTLRL